MNSTELQQEMSLIIQKKRRGEIDDVEKDDLLYQLIVNSGVNPNSLLSKTVGNIKKSPTMSSEEEMEDRKVNSGPQTLKEGIEYYKNGNDLYDTDFTVEQIDDIINIVDFDEEPEAELWS